ncbi:MAG: hypothetical protein HY791_11990 [Deltaproteobacteria bacterium]|nr:hypothetical protein [Deltaproteobacteria bacterium]
MGSSSLGATTTALVTLCLWSCARVVQEDEVVEPVERQGPANRVDRSAAAPRRAIRGAPGSLSPQVLSHFDSPHPAASSATASEPSTAVAPPVSIELGVDWASLYSPKSELSLVEVTSERNAVVLAIRSDRPEFLGAAYGLVDGAELLPEMGFEAERVRVEVPTGAPVVHFAVWLQAVYTDGARADPRQLSARLYTPEHYAASGRTSAGAIVIEWSEIPFSAPTVDDWVLDEATEEEIEFAQTTWGERLANLDSTHDRARALALAIMNGVGAKNGVPSDELSRETPFEQYRRAIAGQERLWCDNYAKIYSRAAASFGIASRIVRLRGKERPGSGVPVVTADGHATNEYFDEQLNRWVWIDLTLVILGARTERGVPLHVATLQQLMIDPDAPPMVLEQYDPETGSIEDLQLDPTLPRWGLKRFFNTDQRFIYFRRAPP